MKKLLLAVCCVFSMNAYAESGSMERFMTSLLNEAGKKISKIDFPSDQKTTQVKAPTDQKIEVAFSPKQGGEELVIKAIRSAEKSIRLAGYSFTSAPITQALIAAKKRGVDVKIVVDFRNNFAQCSDNKRGCSGAHAVAAAVTAGIDARVVSRYPIFHHKFIVVDGKHLETGSFNFSAAAEKSNAENVLVLWNNPQVADTYLTQWDKHWAEGEKAPMAY
jgi:phosphatidylserine/phosphatidylglycerophosphate/cardiolipin synthase-like enzyme